ncbi:hypothetical protein [uncultured Desulfosarcina sp.]
MFRRIDCTNICRLSCLSRKWK